MKGRSYPVATSPGLGSMTRLRCVTKMPRALYSILPNGTKACIWLSWIFAFWATRHASCGGYCAVLVIWPGEGPPPSMSAFETLADCPFAVIQSIPSMTSPFATFAHPGPADTGLIGQQLPVRSFVGFDVYKIKHAQLVWLNEDLLGTLEVTQEQAEQDILKHYAYVTPDYGEYANLNLGDRKVFLADRYGSRYQACNGGSARCGINGSFQIKGIGANPLVSANIDHNHAHGKLCLAEAVNEAIWGEICHRHLPYGAVRTLAIIKTGETIDTDYGLGHRHPQRAALAIRQLAIRPAHFERATFFWPQPAYMALRDDDYLRVQESIACLGAAFEVTEEDRQRIGGSLPYSALITFVEKIARQIGMSRVIGIPHGSLTSSNIAIDGRFLDFGTISAVPDFANYILAAGQGAIWDDHYLISEWIRHLCFFINKYSTEKIGKESQEEIIANFTHKIAETEDLQTACCLGVAGSVEEKKRVGASIKQLLRKSALTPRAFSGFRNSDFSLRLQQVALQLGLQKLSADFPLRQEKYSQYTIASKTAACVTENDGSREALTALIGQYLDPSDSAQFMS